MNMKLVYICLLIATLNGCQCTQKDAMNTNDNTAIKLPSGLQYTITEKAPEDSKTAQAGNRVTVHYTGWLENGTKFDSSVDRNQPFQFNLGRGEVIKGWDEGVAGMKVGETRRLTIPAHLGYGARGAGNIIPANATLIFDVKLLAV